MSRSVSGTKMGVKCDLLRFEGINMANMPIIVDRPTSEIGYK